MSETLIAPTVKETTGIRTPRQRRATGTMVTSSNGRLKNGSTKTTPVGTEGRQVRVLICGGRNFYNRGSVEREIQRLDLEFPNMVLVHGAAPGADSLAEKVAKALGIKTEPHPAEWDKYGKSAGPRRNLEMLQTGIDFGRCISWWCRHSKYGHDSRDGWRSSAQGAKVAA